MTTATLSSTTNLIGGTLTTAEIDKINTMEKNLYLAIDDFCSSNMFPKQTNFHDWSYFDSLSKLRTNIYQNKNPYLLVAYALFLSCNFGTEEVYHAIMRLLILDNKDYNVVDKATVAFREFLALMTSDGAQKTLIEDQRKLVMDSWGPAPDRIFTPGTVPDKINQIITDVIDMMPSSGPITSSSSGIKGNISLAQLKKMLEEENTIRKTKGLPKLDYTDAEIEEIHAELDDEPIQQGGNPKDGLITDNDAQLIMNALKNPNLKKKGVANVAVSYDLDELIKKLESYGYKDVNKLPRSDLKNIFDAVDSDSSGRIEENELPLFIIKLNEQLQAENFNTIADTFASRLLQADKEIEAAKIAAQQTPTTTDDEVNLNMQSLDFNRFLSDVLKLNRKSQGKLLGNGLGTPLTMTNIEGTDYYNNLKSFFATISGQSDFIDYPDYISALRLIDNGLLTYLKDKGTGSEKCSTVPLIAERKVTSNDSILDQILAQEGISHFRDLPFNKYKSVMDKLKIEIDKKAEPPAQAASIKLKPSSSSTQSAQTPEVAKKVVEAVKSGKITNMITGTAIENLFKKIAGDNNNEINAQELVKFMKEYNPDLTFTQENAELLIKSLDTDGNNTLGLVEFASLIGKQNPSNDVIEQYRQLYEGLKDGKAELNKSTLATLLKKNNPADASNIDELVQQADLNKDEKIDFEEFLKLMMEESVDSSAVKKGGSNSKEFISKRDSMDYVISRNESLRDRVRLIGKYKPSNLKKK
jgi:Ca2+-binding EF-hand superfamily protein